MLDSGAMAGGACPAVASTEHACPTCSKPFNPARANQRYCGRACQKNAARGPRTVGESPEQQRRSTVHYSRAMYLAECLYMTPPNKRLGLMQEIIEAAREHDSELRSILTDPKLLRASSDEPGYFFRRAPGAYRTISQAAHAYCKKFWGHGVRAVVHKQVDQPETGEVSA